MSFLDNLKKLVNGVRVQIKCPGCRADSVQSAEKVHTKNIFQCFLAKRLVTIGP